MVATALAPAVFVPSARDRATAFVAAFAVVALAALPWSLTGGPSAFALAAGGAGAMWWLIGAAVAATVFAFLGQDQAVAVVSAFGVTWAFGAGFAESPQGPAFGIGAALALIALTVCFARAIARRGVFAGDPVIATIVVVVAAMLAIFIFFPVGKALLASVLDQQGRF
ncbi:MAG TPA: hypothetical protein VFJ48_02170, partial [Casimicrobiaceae bacterium]|nr:hypothetical protein [Casimicrobiaceae bacterium]